MRRMAQEGDDDLRDWLAGRWPALFRNKPEPAIAAARALCVDRELDWFMRAEGAEVTTAAAHKRGELERQAALRQHLEGHYAAWPEMKLPALGGKTPLEAMQDPDGREMVEALLLQFERHPPPQLASGYDVIIGRLRERLGLSQKC